MRLEGSVWVMITSPSGTRYSSLVTGPLFRMCSLLRESTVGDFHQRHGADRVEHDTAREPTVLGRKTAMNIAAGAAESAGSRRTNGDSHDHTNIYFALGLKSQQLNVSAGHQIYVDVRSTNA